MRRRGTPSHRTVLEEEHFDLAADDEKAAKRFYIGYIASFALVDLTALLRLSTDVAPWVHVLVTLLLSAVAVLCITLYVRTTARTSRYRTVMLRHLLNAHNERATSLDVVAI